MQLFHGGKPGLKAGDVILPGQPHYIDGCADCAARKAGIGTEANPIPLHPDRVYVTSDRAYGRYYASLFVFGDLYSVEPLDELVDAGREDPFPTWHCARVRVRSVAERCIRLTDRERRRLVARWAVQDERRGLNQWQVRTAPRPRSVQRSGATGT